MSFSAGLRTQRQPVPLEISAPWVPYRSAVTTTLITGANRGLGFEVARQLVAAGQQVWIGARDETRGGEAADAVGARFVQLDVTDCAKR